MKAKIIAASAAVLLLIGTLVFDSTIKPTPMIIKQEEVIAARQNAGPVPQFSFQTMDGKNYALKDLKHDTILIHFWAGWCTVCFAEFPELLDYVAQSSGKVALLSIAIDDDLKPAKKFMQRLNALDHVDLDVPNVYWIWDETKDISLHTFNTVRVPETIVVNDQRQMVDKIVGPISWMETF